MKIIMSMEDGSSHPALQYVKNNKKKRIKNHYKDAHIWQQLRQKLLANAYSFFQALV